MLVERVFVFVCFLVCIMNHCRQHRTLHFMVLKVVFEGETKESDVFVLCSLNLIVLLSLVCVSAGGQCVTNVAHSVYICRGFGIRFELCIYMVAVRILSIAVAYGFGFVTVNHFCSEKILV